MSTGERRTTALRRLLQSSRMEFLMEAHNGVSARIAEEAGFAGIWGSGLTLSAQAAVRDNNELSWTQVVDALELMSDATSVPILLDGDTGYGDFNNLRRLVHKLEQRHVAGVCIEDKLFPKTNSFIHGETQPLADIDEFCGKIRAGKDSQSDPDFCLVARVEALIAGRGMDEALSRANAYVEAGADAILIHSKRSDPEEILEFARRWGERVPLVIVPTTYYATPTDIFRRAGISVVIWANHLLRAAVTAMQATAGRIQRDQSLVDVEGQVAPVAEIFRLQGAQELLDAERQYARVARATRAVILAATRGDALADLTADRPKAMVSVAGRPVLAHLAERFRAAGITGITAVAGYRAETVEVSGVDVTVNPDYESGGELGSLRCARSALADDTVLVYGDLLFRDYVLAELLSMPDPLVAVVDSAPIPAYGTQDLAYCSAPDDRGLYRPDVRIEHVGAHGGPQREPDGRWIGMLRVQHEGRAWLLKALDALDDNAASVPDLINRLVGEGRPVRVLYIHGHWLDVNNLEDLQRADAFARGERAGGLPGERP